MAIFRCKCGHVREVSDEYIGRTVKCPQCKQSVPIHDTVTFVKKVLDKYVSLYTEYRRLQAQQVSLTDLTGLSKDINTIPERADIDIYNTTALTQSQQYEPILDWFRQRQIQVNVDHKAIDTTGFFDEIAIQLGDEYDALQVVSDKIKYIQGKGYSNVKLNLSKNSQKEIKSIRTFCQALYDYSFVAKYRYYKNDHILRLDLQTAKAIVNFFNGEWLEWYVFMKSLELFREKNIQSSCLRSFTITFPNEDLHELDVFFLVNNSVPVYIECKSGEFRQDIKKYETLRKRLNIGKEYFLLCAIGLSDEQAQGLTSMYDITFVNEKSLIPYISMLSWDTPTVLPKPQEEPLKKTHRSMFFFR